MEINKRRVKAHELIVFFLRAMHAEGYSKIKIVILVPFILLMTLLNLLLLNFPYKRLENFLDVCYIIDFERNGEVLGGYITVDKIEQSGYLYFGGFFVRSQYQGMGIGTRVLRQLIETYESVNIRLDVDMKNNKAIKLYKKLGFEVLKNEKNQILMIHRSPNTKNNGVHMG